MVRGLECLCVPTDAAAKSKLFPCGWMFDVQWTFRALEGLCTWPDGALGQLALGHAGQALEVVMAGVAEVGGAEAEVDCHGAAVAALVLEEVTAVLGADLNGGERRTIETAAVLVGVSCDLPALPRPHWHTTGR